ncbi:MAG: SurA N-terminal domain-containing protein [Candidatus Aureabacteria bacterium]|nr:SurA N-terminal domain-containing protein [Candidatus Auribacterota bacterium]
MLVKIHKYSKAIFIAILVLIIPAFIFWGSGGAERAKGPVAGYIFEKPVSSAAFSSSLRGAGIWKIIELCEYYNVRNPEALLANKWLIDNILSQENALRQAAWDRLILEKEALDIGLSVSDEEIEAWISSFPLFQSNGHFEESKFNAVISTIFLGISPGDFLEELKRSLLSIKIIRLIRSTAVVTENEVKNYFLRENEKRDVSFIVFDYKDFVNEVSYSVKEMEDFYNANKNLLKIPEKAKIDYISIKVDDKDPSIQITEAELEAFYKKNSKNYKKEDGSEKTYSEAKSDVKKDLSAKKVYENASAKITEVFFDIDSGELSPAKAADNSGLSLKTTEYFSRSDSVEGISNSALFTKMSFETPLNKVSEPVFTGTEFIIVIPKAKIPAAIPAFEDCKDKISEILKIKKASEASLAAAESAREQILKLINEDPSLGIEKASSKLGFKTQSEKAATLKSQFSGIGNSYMFTSIAFSIKENILSEPVETSSGASLLWITKIDMPDMAKFDEMKKSYTEKALAIKQNIVLSEWYRNLFRKANLKELASQN